MFVVWLSTRFTELEYAKKPYGEVKEQVSASLGGAQHLEHALVRAGQLSRAELLARLDFVGCIVGMAVIKQRERQGPLAMMSLQQRYAWELGGRTPIMSFQVLAAVALTEPVRSTFEGTGMIPLGTVYALNNTCIDRLRGMTTTGGQV